MKKILVAIAVVVAVAIVGIVVWASLANSGSTEPRSVEGTWSYEVTGSNSTGTGAVTIFRTTKQGTWEGDLDGTATSVQEAEAKSGGAGSFEETVSFEGSVEVETGRRRDGTLEILCIGSRQDRESDWVGTWEIVEGEGELANLRGGGTFTSVQHSSVVDYSGEIHFDR